MISTAALSIGNASLNEGGTLPFMVTRSGNTAIAACKSYATENETAITSIDYAAPNASNGR